VAALTRWPLMTRSLPLDRTLAAGWLEGVLGVQPLPSPVRGCWHATHGCHAAPRQLLLHLHPVLLAGAGGMDEAELRRRAEIAYQRLAELAGCRCQSTEIRFPRVLRLLAGDCAR
jgi:hypothetical protein